MPLSEAGEDKYGREKMPDDLAEEVITAYLRGEEYSALVEPEAEGKPSELFSGAIRSYLSRRESLSDSELGVVPFESHAGVEYLVARLEGDTEIREIDENMYEVIMKPKNYEGELELVRHMLTGPLN